MIGGEKEIYTWWLLAVQQYQQFNENSHANHRHDWRKEKSYT